MGYIQKAMMLQFLGYFWGIKEAFFESKKV
jgi:hypothetical protein